MKSMFGSVRFALRNARNAGVQIPVSNTVMVPRVLEIHQELEFPFGQVSVNGLPLEVSLALQPAQETTPVQQVQTAEVETSSLLDDGVGTEEYFQTEKKQRDRKEERRADRGNFEPWHKRVRNRIVREGRRFREATGYRPIVAV